MRGHNLPIMKVRAFLDVMSRCLVGTYQQFGATSCLDMKREDYTASQSDDCYLHNYRENGWYIYSTLRRLGYSACTIYLNKAVVTAHIRRQLLFNILKSRTLPSVSCDSSQQTIDCLL
jgi:hypothetical protein